MIGKRVVSIIISLLLISLVMATPKNKQPFNFSQATEDKSNFEYYRDLNTPIYSLQEYLTMLSDLHPDPDFFIFNIESVTTGPSTLFPNSWGSFDFLRYALNILLYPVAFIWNVLVIMFNIAAIFTPIVT